MQAIIFPNISPVAFTVYGFDIYWYSFAYILGAVLGYLLMIRLNKISNMFTINALDDLICYSVVGIVIGARLMFSLAYDLPNVITDPLRILMIRQGGLSFHGGLLGACVAVYFVVRKHKLDFRVATDILACVVPIGLCLGRIANFINAEIYGKVTTLPWGIVFPGAGPLPRHPTQLYEALGEGILLFAVMLFCFPRFYKQHGALSGIFLITYASIRSVLELTKDPAWYDLPFISMGQLLCIPMILVGMYMLLTREEKNVTNL